jgi:hypothetical protein
MLAKKLWLFYNHGNSWTKQMEVDLRHVQLNAIYKHLPLSDDQAEQSISFETYVKSNVIATDNHSFKFCA